MSNLLPGAASVERFLAWELLGNGKVRGLWKIPEPQEPDSYVELHLDARGRVVGVREWLEGEERPVERRFSLDAGGRLKRSDRTGPAPTIEFRNSYTYDRKGRLTERQETDVESGAIRFRTTSKVDGRGFIVENAMHDGKGVLKERTTYERNPAGRPTKEYAYRADGPIGYFLFSYDNDGHEVQRIWHKPDGTQKAITDTRYQGDLPVEITLTIPGKASRSLHITYDPRGRKVSTEVQNADGSKHSEVRPSAGGVSWRRSFVAPPPETGDGRGGRFAPKPPPGGSERQQRIALAYHHFEEEEYAVALPMFERLAQENERDVYVLSAVGACAFKLGRWEMAIAFYERALAIDASHELSQRGRDLALQALG